MYHGNVAPRYLCLSIVWVFLHLPVVDVHADCSSRLIKDGRKQRFKLFCPTAAGLRVDRQWLVYHHPPPMEPLEPINKQPRSFQTHDGWCCLLRDRCGFRPSLSHLFMVNPTILPEVLCQFTHKSQRGANSVSLLHWFCPVPITAPGEGEMKRPDQVGCHDRSFLLTARGEEVFHQHYVIHRLARGDVITRAN